MYIMYIYLWAIDILYVYDIGSVAYVYVFTITFVC